MSLYNLYTTQTPLPIHTGTHTHTQTHVYMGFFTTIAIRVVLASGFIILYNVQYTKI